MDIGPPFRAYSALNRSPSEFSDGLFLLFNELFAIIVM